MAWLPAQCECFLLFSLCVECYRWWEWEWDVRPTTGWGMWGLFCSSRDMKRVSG